MAEAIQLFLWRSRLSSPSSLVKLGIKSIEVFAVQMILGGSQGFTKALEMNDLSFSKKFDRITYIGVIN